MLKLEQLSIELPKFAPSGAVNHDAALQRLRDQLTTRKKLKKQQVAGAGSTVVPNLFDSIAMVWRDKLWPSPMPDNDVEMPDDSP